MSETQIEPQSIAADRESQADPDLSTYRVLRRDDTNVWTELHSVISRSTPTASEIGSAYGEGDYLLIETESRYSFKSAYEMRVVADRVYRLAEDA